MTEDGRAPGAESTRRVAVVMTCHYRRDPTVACLRCLREQSATGDEWPGPIIVGAAEHPDTHEPTYGGRVRIVPVSPAPRRADPFHGNVVLAPMAVRHRVSPIDGALPHAYADDDYGLRATALGIPIIQAPGTVATCRANHGPTDAPATARARCRQVQSPKGLPVASPDSVPARARGRRWPAISSASR